MNKIHNIIWSKAQGAWVVVAEGTKAASKAGGAGLKVMIALIMLSPVAGNAATLPQDGTISVGQGTIVTNGANEMVIKQTTDKLGINWQSFNVGADGHVIFDQPGTHSIALNRVIGSDGSAILGKIDANGQVFLINPNGVIFGKDAKVNVGGLVASTMDITEEDFKNGTYKLASVGKNGEVINNGTLQAAEGGYIALLGKSVKNNGLIKAQLGSATMAAGDAVTLDFSGDGLINVQVTKSAVKALVDNQGAIQADGGSVLMTARATNALLDTVVNNDGIVQAQTINSKAGKIFLDGGTAGGAVSVAGTLDASAPVTGDGGFIETSGSNVKISGAVKVTTLANTGKTGNWVIDPQDFNINAGSGSQTLNSIGADLLSSQLELTNVAITTDSSGTGGAGDINVNAAVSWGANTTLTLNADNDINIKQKISVNGDAGGLALNYAGRVNVTGDGVVKLNGLNTTYAENGQAFEVIRDFNGLLELSTQAASGRRFVLGGDIDASATDTYDSYKGFSSDSNESTPITNLTLNGLGNTIEGFRINRPTQDYVGLFGAISNSSISNLKMTGAVNGQYYAGMLAGYISNSNIYNIYVDGGANGTNYVGGIVGKSMSSKLDGISFGGMSTGNWNVGGIVGYSQYNTISDLEFYRGSVYGTGGSIGGLIGESQSDTSLTNLRTTSEVSVTGKGQYVGGAIGYLGYFAKATDISTAGEVSGADYVGGAFGYARNGSVAAENIKSSTTVNGANSVGGLIGWSYYLKLKNAFATGSVTASGNMIGGLVGESDNSFYTNVYASGDVTGLQSIGGLIGESRSDQISNAFSMSKTTGQINVGGFIGNAKQSIITNAYATGDVNADNYNAGGFVGNSYYTNYKYTYSAGKVTSSSTKGGYAGAVSGDVFTSSYWDTQKSGLASSAGGAVGKTTAQMQQSSTFAGWSIDAVGGDANKTWRIYEGSGMPLLTFMMPTLTINGVGAGSYTGKAITWDDLYMYGATGNLNSFWGDQSSTFKGVIGTPTSGGNAIINAGDYRLDSLVFDQFGWNVVKYQPTSLDITVAKKYLSVNDVNPYRRYDGTTDVTGTILSIADGQVIDGDEVLLDYSGAYYESKNAGFNNLHYGEVKLLGADAANYSIWSALTDGTRVSSVYINPKMIEAVVPVTDKTYDGTNVANVTLAVKDGQIVAGDSIDLGYASATYAYNRAGDNQSIYVSGVYVTGADASNYSVGVSNAFGEGSILKANLNISAAGADKVYDGSTSANVTLGSGKLIGDDVQISYGSSNFLDKNAGSGKVIQVDGITVTGGDAWNYYWDTTVLAMANITKAALSISAVASGKTYDGTTDAQASLTDDRIAGDDLAISYGSAEFADKNAGAGKSVTVSDITVTGADAQNYDWNTVANTSADVAKAQLTLTADVESKVYDATRDATVALSDDRASGDQITVAAGQALFDTKNAGTAKVVTIDGITVSGADADNYTWSSSATSTADISKAHLDVTAVVQDKTYDGTTSVDYALADNRVSGDDLVVNTSGAAFSDKNAGAGKTVTIDGLTLTGADAANYEVGSSVATTATINKAVLSVTSDAAGKVYDGLTDTSATLTDNRVAGDDLNLAYDAAEFGDKNAGANKLVTVTGISVSGTDSGNYVWNTSDTTTASISKADLALTASADGKVYDGGLAATGSIAGQVIAGDDVTIGFDGATFADKNAAAGKNVEFTGVSVTGSDASNYTWATSVTGQADISKAELSIDGVTQNKTYDGTLSAQTSLTDNRIAGDDLTISSADSLFADKNAGAGKSVETSGITVSGSDVANYTWAETVASSADIDKANLVLVGTTQDKIYDGSDSAQTSFTDNRIAGDVLTVMATDSRFSDKNAANDKSVITNGITVVGADADNYTWNASETTSASISKADLSLAANANGKVYDGGVAATGSISGQVIAGDDVSIGYDEAKFSDKNAATSKNVEFTGISVTGADASNYTWSGSVAGVADITKAELSINGVTQNKTYDGTLAANTSLKDNRVDGDDLTLSSAGSLFADKNAGSGKSVVTSGIAVSGADAANYTWADSVTSSADIAKADLALVGATQDKIYDGSTSAETSFTDSRIAGDILTVTAGESSFDDKNAGAGKSVTTSGISVTGADAENYTWASTQTTMANIDKASLTISATGVDKSYDGTLDAKLSIADDRIEGDDLKIDYSAAFKDKNAGAGKSIAINGMAVSGADAANYNWSSDLTAEADITKASLVIAADSAGKTSGAVDSPLSWHVESGKLFGSDSIEGSLARDKGEQQGTYAITKGSLTAGSNYDLTVKPGQFVISKPAVNVELNETKEVVSAISASTATHSKSTTSTAPGSNDSPVSTVGGGYGLLNLGMKLPDDLLRDES